MEFIMYNTDMTYATSLEQFYNDLTRKQEEHSGDHYCAVHKAIQFCVSQCETYKELGVNQGTTAAAAILCKPRAAYIIDHKLEKFEPCRHLFEEYCSDNNVLFKAAEMSSISPKAVSRADVLYIDTSHVPQHLQTELQMHQQFIKNYIIMHDTEAKPALHDVIVDFVKKNPWKIVEHNRQNVGYTVIERV